MFMTVETKLDGSRRVNNKGCQSQPANGTARLNLGQDWTESEWFKVWLQLAREGREANRN